MASRIVAVFIVVCGCQKAAMRLAVARMSMRSGLSAIPIVSIFIPAASAFALV